MRFARTHACLGWIFGDVPKQGRGTCLPCFLDLEPVPPAEPRSESIDELTAALWREFSDAVARACRDWKAAGANPTEKLVYLDACLTRLPFGEELLLRM